MPDACTHGRLRGATNWACARDATAAVRNAEVHGEGGARAAGRSRWNRGGGRPSSNNTVRKKLGRCTTGNETRAVQAKGSRCVTDGN